MKNTEIAFNFKDFYKKFELGCILEYYQSYEVFRDTYSRIYLIGRLTGIIKNMENFNNLYPYPRGRWTALFWTDESTTELHEYNYTTLLTTIMASLLFEETDQKIRLCVQDAFRSALEVYKEDTDLTHFNTDKCRVALITAMDALRECTNNPSLSTSDGVCSCLLSEDTLKLKRNSNVAQKALDSIQADAISLLGRHY